MYNWFVLLYLLIIYNFEGVVNFNQNFYKFDLDSEYPN